MKEESQTKKIITYLNAGNTLTPLDALHLFGCFRLAARIKEIREIGYKVNTRTVKFNGKSVAEYSI